MDYSILGDSVYRYGDKRHRMADDSMIVNIGGSKGGLTAYLQLTDAGFEGRFFTTTMYREKGPSGRMVLSRTDCTGRALISGRAPVDVKEPPSP